MISAVDSDVRVDAVKHDRDGCVAYLVVDGSTKQALVIDPRLDQVAELQALLRRAGATLRWVVDTHTHADHLSGARKLARAEGAELLAHAASKLAAPARRVRGGDVLRLGEVEVRVLDAPGHTPDSLALLVGGHLFTGDTLFVGGAGRTDFPGGSASDLFDTFRRFAELPDETVVHPGHDYVQRPESTIGEEKRTNPLLAEADRDRFVARLAVEGAPPPNITGILRANLAADDAATVSPEELSALLHGGVAPALLDVRGPLEFESERIEGSRNVPLDELERRVDEVPAGDLVIVCRTGVRATIAADTLRRHGRAGRVLEGGVVAWRKAGLPLKEGKKRLGVDRQVQLIVGAAVLSTALLGAFVSPWFLVVTSFFGAGLLFAGATGTCGLALLLMKAPWNRTPPPPPDLGAGACAVGGSVSTGGACAVGGACSVGAR